MGASEIPSATAVPINDAEMVQVIAPATLNAGYSFQAIYNGSTFTVVVPAGGVKEGQKMTVPFEAQASEWTPFASAIDSAPHGRFKDGLCDCLKFGPCHPSFLNACCFPQILMAQVMTRMKLNIFGNEAPSQEYKVTFSRMVMVVIAYWILASIFSPPSPEFEADKHGNVTVTRDDCPIWQRAIYNLVTTAFTLYTLIILIKLRAAVRKRYQIPEQRCYGMEDCCCAFWCGCCTVAQLARQTADYDQIRAVCCSETGLPSLSPAIIV